MNSRIFRSILNLGFLSKVVEICVAKQLIDYLDANGLAVSYQSAYRKLHSTETALIRVHNDIAIASDQKRSVILLLLDLSAAFDTVATVSYFHAFLVDLELVVRHWHGFDRIWVIALSL